ncbi:MAG: hypothetical protein RI842_09890 [Schleiferiaceae bacterium]|nr:hypothetical protein [Schleiferiaceae bacterium]
MQDTFRVGDTLHVSSVFDHWVYDQHGGGEYKLVDYNFYPGIGFTLISDTNFKDVPQQKVEFYSTTNELSPFHSNHVYTSYVYEEDTYYLRYKIVLQDTGLFMLSHGASLIGAKGAQDFPGRCGRERASANMALENADSANIHLLEDSPDPHYHDWVLQKPQQRFYDGAGFAFYVKPR